MYCCLLGPWRLFYTILQKKHGWVFFVSLLGITPLAERLGYATKQLACYMGPTVGGLLNAKFGNATGDDYSMYALKNGMIMIVQQSLLGSILSNMLLVLGCAFSCGGMVHRHKVQNFSKVVCSMNAAAPMFLVYSSMNTAAPLCTSIHQMMMVRCMDLWELVMHAIRGSRTKNT